MEQFDISRRLGQFVMGHSVSDTVRVKLSASLKGREPTRGFAGKHHTVVTRRKYSEDRKGVPKKQYTLSKPRMGIPTGRSPSVETRRKLSITMKLKGQHPPWWLAPRSEHTKEAKTKMGDVWGERRADESKMRAWVKALHLKPNKAERFLDSILQQEFPASWRYTGDGLDGTQIGGKIPDWMNINGRKAVIELFGDFWHQEKTRTPEATIEHYRKYGFTCLIIDYRELRKHGKVISKVRDFIYETA